MDIETLLNIIFEEYKTKAIKEEKELKKVEARLKVVKDEMEMIVKSKTDDFIGQPNNEMTRLLLLDTINQNLNQFLDTDIRVESIEQDVEHINVNLSYRPKDTVSKIIMCDKITTFSDNPTQDIMSLQL
jgi:hypothetical protein